MRRVTRSSVARCAAVAQLPPPGFELRIALLERGHLRSLLAGLAIGRDPRHGRADVEVEDEQEDGDQRPAPEAVPPYARGSHAWGLRSTPGAPFLCTGAPGRQGASDGGHRGGACEFRGPVERARRFGPRKAPSIRRYTATGSAARVRKPSRQLPYAGAQPSSRRALAFEAPRDLVMSDMPDDPTNSR